MAITHHNNGSQNETFVGMVVASFNESERIMSDVWDTVTKAVVFDGVGFTTKWLDYGYHHNPNDHHVVKVDASQDILDVYAVWQKGRQFGKDLASYDNREEQAACERKIPGNGKWVNVARGRKVAKGTKGIVFWTGHDGFGGTKLGIAITGRKVNNRYVDVVWTAAKNCDVIDVAQF